MKYLLILTLFSVVVYCGASDVSLQTFKEGDDLLTLKCSINQSLPANKIVWTRNGFPILATFIMGYSAPLGNMKSPYGVIWGRYYVTARGYRDHRVTLMTQKSKDQGSVWACVASGYRSNNVTLIVAQDEDHGEFRCEAGCIIGSAGGATLLFLLVISFITAMCCKSRREY